MEVGSPASGVLLKRFHKEGDVVPVGRVLAVLGQGNEPTDEVIRSLEHKQTS